MNITLSRTLPYAGVLKAGQYLMCIGLLFFGIQHFLYGDFVTGRAPEFPFNNSGKVVWAYITGALFILTAVMIVLGKRARLLLLLLALIVFVWGVIRQLPILINVNFRWGGEIVSAGKGLTLFGGLLAMAASLPAEEGWRVGKLLRYINQSFNFILIARYCMGIFLVICGIEHFIFVDFVKTLVPDWIPGNIFLTYFTGVALVAGGLGLFIRQTAPLAALLTGMMIFIWFAILHLPRAVVMDTQNEWTAATEALTFSGIAFIIAGFMRKH
jgi:uncharacterized membrane protein